MVLLILLEAPHDTTNQETSNPEACLLNKWHQPYIHTAYYGYLSCCHVLCIMTWPHRGYDVSAVLTTIWWGG